MSVFVTFEPSKTSGVVAAGTYLIDAAHRLGVPLGAQCARNNENHSCLVSVVLGSALLSPRGIAEERVLSDNGLDSSFRIACQVKIEYPGDLIVNLSSRTVGPIANASVTDEDVRQKFGQLPLNQKIATLLKLEAITMSEAVDAALEKPRAFGTRALDSVLKRARSSNADETTTK